MATINTRGTYAKNQLFFQLDHLTVEQDERVVFISYSTWLLAFKLVQHYGAWRNRYSTDLTRDDPPALTDEEYKQVLKIYDLALEELGMAFSAPQFVKSQMLIYGALTGEEVNLNLSDPDNVVNGEGKVTPKSPFNMPKHLAFDLNLIELLYRSTHTDRAALFNLQYPDSAYGKSLADILAQLEQLKVEVSCNGGLNGVDVSDQIQNISQSLLSLRDISQGVLAAGTALDAAAEWGQLGIDATMAGVESLDKATDEMRDIAQSIAQGVTAFGSLATALGTWAGAVSNAVGMMSIRNAIVGVTNELAKLNANIGGPGAGSGWWDWLKYNFYGGAPPASYQPTLNEIAAAHLQAQREMNEVQGGNPNLNVADTISAIGNGSGQSDK